MKRKKYILIFVTIASLFYVASYICLNSPIAAVANAIYLVRGITFLIMDKKKLNFVWYLIPIFIFLSAMSLTLYLCWNNPLDITILIGLIITTFAYALKNTLFLRIGLIINSLLWCIYNFVLAAYANLSTNLLNIAIVLSAIIVYNIVQPLNHKKRDEQLATDEEEAERILKTKYDE